jgi:hypothetical protein
MDCVKIMENRRTKQYGETKGVQKVYWLSIEFKKKQLITLKYKVLLLTFVLQFKRFENLLNNHQK